MLSPEVPLRGLASSHRGQGAMPEEGATKCLAYVQTYDTKPKRRSFDLFVSVSPIVDYHRNRDSWGHIYAFLLRDHYKRSIIALGVGASLSSQMKIYISSTYQDLNDHGNGVDRTLRRMGHDVI